MFTQYIKQGELDKTKSAKYSGKSDKLELKCV